MNGLIIAALRAQVIVLEARAECLRSYPMNVAFNLEAAVIDKQVGKINAAIADLESDEAQKSGAVAKIMAPDPIGDAIYGTMDSLEIAFMKGRSAFIENPQAFRHDRNPYFMLTNERVHWFNGWDKAKEEADARAKDLPARRQKRAYEMGYAAFKNGLDIEQNPQPEEFKSEWNRGWLCANADWIKASPAYVEGRNAAASGDARSTNPYRQGSSHHKHWDLGWCDHNAQRGQ